MKLTVRIEDGECWASDDTGMSGRLEGRAAELEKWWKEVSTFEAPSAAVLADLAQARAARPRSTPVSVDPGPPLEGERKSLGPLQLDDSNPLGQVLRGRRSTRTFGPMTISALASVLMRAGRVVDWTEVEDGFQATHRPVPSAGGRHPFDLQVIVGRGVQGLVEGAYAFDPVGGALVTQRLGKARSEEILLRVGEQLASPSPPPAAIFLIGRLQRTLGRYPTGMSLVWRDAGVLLQTLHLCAFDLGLNSCILGTCGSLEDDVSLVDMGALAIGGPPHGPRRRGTSRLDTAL